jgi:hypothetical protein
MSVRSVFVRSWPFAVVTLLFAGSPARADDDVHISVVAILATTKNAHVDEQVAYVAREMQRVDPKLTGFTVDRMTCKDVKIGGKDCFEVVDGQKVCVTVEKKCDKDNRVCLKIEPPTLGAITYTTCCGKWFAVATRYKTKSGDVLIIAVRVKTCKD